MALDSSASLRITGMLREHLRPGEDLIWYGAPDRSALLSRGDAFLIPFSILWLAFASFWEFGVAGTGVVFAELWGIPFIALGLYLTAGRFVYKRVSRKGTAYGVTQDRAMIVTARTFRDLPLRDVPISVRRSRGGTRVSVIMGTDEPVMERAGSFGARRPRAAPQYAMYANTGVEPLLGSVRWPFAFYDVEDPGALLAAIDRARTPSTW